MYEQEIAYISEGFDEAGKELIKKSFEFALKAHSGQERMSGDPYITHGIEVAKVLKEMKMDAVTISAGFLHDIIEDTDYGVNDLIKVAGENTAFLVEGVSQVTAKVFKTKGEKLSDSLKKMFLAMAKDIRVIIIKLADRLHNMRTVQFLPEERQKAIAAETLSVYAPLAHRLGMAKVKWELEDISFSILNPKAYREISDKIALKRGARESRIIAIKKIIKEELDDAGIKNQIKGRPKHFYSIYNKMIRDNKPFEAIFDLIAVRIITDSINDCYTILGIIHNRWKPVPGRFKDFIAMPKQNMYRSLHTTVLDKDGYPIEVQIRTAEMDKIAEEGIAAHWTYKEQKSSVKEKQEAAAFGWIRQLLDWNSSMRDSEDFLNDLKVDLFDEEVFVFTPKGDVKELVKGATVLDFAYSVHSELGDKCTGAKVNGKWVTIKYELKNGDIVEILKGPGRHPVVDWLKIVKTTKAKNRIRHWLRTNQGVDENIAKGRELLVEKLKEFNIELSDVPGEIMKKIFEHYSLKNKEELFAGIGDGEFSELRAANIIRRLSGAGAKVSMPRENTEKMKEGDIIVQGGLSDVAHKFAKCCSPVPGDAIAGIYTKKGISIHRQNCSNMHTNKITAPIVDVDWSKKAVNFYLCRIKVHAKNRDGLVNDILNIVTKNGAYISSVNSNILHGAHVESDLYIKVKGQRHITDVIDSIKRVKSVMDARRVEA
ncbi:MAG: RelA/SpoT family protein [Candidatus Goldiibacteriota bacterium]